jgi:hypothetical protein
LFKYRYLPVFGIGVLGITGITVFEKVGIFAIPSHKSWTEKLHFSTVANISLPI